MGASNAVDVLRLARELEQQDADVAERLDSVEILLQEVDEIRARAAATREAIEALPEQVRHAEQAAATASERQSIAAAGLADAHIASWR